MNEASACTSASFVSFLFLRIFFMYFTATLVQSNSYSVLFTIRCTISWVPVIWDCFSSKDIVMSLQIIYISQLSAYFCLCYWHRFNALSIYFWFITFSQRYLNALDSAERGLLILFIESSHIVCCMCYSHGIRGYIILHDDVQYYRQCFFFFLFFELNRCLNEMYAFDVDIVLYIMSAYSMASWR